MAAVRRLGAAVASQSYDYVVVGAGSAGCVMAHRLAKDRGLPEVGATLGAKEHGASVLLLEAGRGDRGSWDSWKIQMPAALTFNLANDKYNWDYYTVPHATWTAGGSTSRAARCSAAPPA
ncbi:unnamed protein product [Prorocentrum cordatum]|uniref:Choline dehydrogenase n=1 Tax=Prorocentrum cordatum TaxID=2364126 RepID=A0ABN9VC27_9DINO|nr:unnamed protein product [Polarella glacialis]